MYQMLRSTVQEQQPAQKEGPDLTGIPKQMKLDFEERSGASLNDVRVQYNSEKPARLQALAYTQGSRIYIAPGQERHLRHELAHVIQQKQGRVRATARVNGMAVNDEERLEREADLGQIPVQRKAGAEDGTVQRKIEDDGHLSSKRNEDRKLMYNHDAFRWKHSQKEPDGAHVVDGQGALHHIIPRQTLRKFWDIIVDYYPDLWGDMVHSIFTKVDEVFNKSEEDIYQSKYKEFIFGAARSEKEKLSNEIRREANILQDIAFRGMKTTLAGGSEEETRNKNRFSIQSFSSSNHEPSCSANDKIYLILL